MIAELRGEDSYSAWRFGRSFGEGKKMDPWRDFPSFTDGALDAFLKRFPSIPTTPPRWLSLSVGVKSATNGVEAGSDQAEAIPVGKGLLTWVRNAAIAGLQSLRLQFFPWLFQSLLQELSVRGVQQRCQRHSRNRRRQTRQRLDRRQN